jgi:hypothetical protein
MSGGTQKPPQDQRAMKPKPKPVQTASGGTQKPKDKRA